MPNLGALLIERKPDTVVIAHGTNELPIRPGYSHGKLPGRPPSLKEIESALMKAEGDATRTIRAVKKSGAKCVWIGPPSEPEEIYSIDLQDKFTRMYAEACRAAGCKFLDSRTVTKATDTKKDTAMGVHYYGAAGTAWGRDIAVQVIQEIRPTPPSEAKNQKSDGVSGVQAK